MTPRMTARRFGVLVNLARQVERDRSNRVGPAKAQVLDHLEQLQDLFACRRKTRSLRGR